MSQEVGWKQCCWLTPVLLLCVQSFPTGEWKFIREAVNMHQAWCSTRIIMRSHPRMVWGRWAWRLVQRAGSPLSFRLRSKTQIFSNTLIGCENVVQCWFIYDNQEKRLREFERNGMRPGVEFAALHRPQMPTWWSMQPNSTCGAEPRGIA